MPDSSISEFRGPVTRYEGNFREKLGKILAKFCTVRALAGNGEQSAFKAAILAAW
jgi:hypothetical protein